MSTYNYSNVRHDGQHEIPTGPNLYHNDDQEDDYHDDDHHQQQQQAETSGHRRQYRPPLPPPGPRSRSGRHLLLNGTPVDLTEIQSDFHPHAAGFGGGIDYDQDDISNSMPASDTADDIFHDTLRQAELAQQRGIHGGIPVKVNSQRSLRSQNNNSYHHHSISYHGDNDDRTQASGSTNATGRHLNKESNNMQQQALLQELRDPSYLINLLEDMVPKIINNQLGTNKNQILSIKESENRLHDVEDKRKNKRQVENQQRRDQAEQVWEKVRRWLWANPSTDDDDPLQHSMHMLDESLRSVPGGGGGSGNRTAGAFVRGLNDMTPLHLVCKLPYPPEDIVNALIQAAPDTASWTDAHGWLPLHHVAANGCSTDVLTMLLEVFEDGKLQQDQQKRTPLHFYATRPSHVDNPTTMSQNATLLCHKVGQGSDAITAAQLTDMNGMLPIHYACAYGTHTSVLKALAKIYPKGLTSRERHGRAPMHLAMVNAHREEAQAVLKFLLDYNDESKNTINARDRQGFLPLHLLAAGLKQQMVSSNKSNRISDDLEKRNTVSECLSLYLAAEPKAAADFLTAIKDLPDWLQDTAVVSKHVRNVLNEKIVQCFPTSVLMLDGIVLIVVIVCFAICSKNQIDLRFDPTNTINDTQHSLITVIAGATYFLIRELVQFAALLALGSISSWFKDPANWLDMFVITMVFYYSILMLLPNNIALISLSTFRAGVAFTQGVLWVKFIVFLKKTLVDFAVFVGGVFYVVQRLVAFIIAVGTILIAFGQMFYFVYVDTPMCDAPSTGGGEYTLPDGTIIDTDQFASCQFPHCTFGGSFLKVYTMMMGEINDVFRYATNLEAQLLFVAYAFLVVILLSNVLIAIVQDSYEVVQNERAAIVFWTNRLDFVAETDSIMYAIQRRLGCLKCCFGTNQVGGIYGKDGYAYNGDDDDKNTNDDVEHGTTTDVANSSNNMNNESAEQAPGLLQQQRNSSGALGENSETTAVSQRGRGRGRANTNTAMTPEGSSPISSNDTDISHDVFREAWQQLMSLFDTHLYDDVDWIESWVYNIFRLLSIFVIIPLWLVLGFATAGILWPPQIREFLFVQRETVVSRAELERHKLTQLKAIQTEMKDLKIEIMREMAHDRDEMIRLKAEIETIQGEIYADMMQVKELMDSLLIMS